VRAGEGTGGSEPAILYARVCDFYAAVERAVDPALVQRAVLVGGDPRKRGRVQSATPDARALGVVEGMPMQEALARCPGAHRVTTDMKRYRETNGRLTLCLRRVASELEPSGLGAAFIAASGQTGEPQRLAERLAAAVADDLGMGLTIGIAPDRYLARLVAHETPEGERLWIRRAEVNAFLARLPLARLPNVGPRTLEKLHAMGVTSVGAFAGLEAGRVEAELGNHGLTILEQIRGEGAAAVRVARHPASISRSLSLLPDGDADGEAASALDARSALRRLAHLLGMELTRQGLQATRAAIRVNPAESGGRTRSRTLESAITSEPEILAVASELLADALETAPRLRSLRLALAGLSPVASDERQLELFGSSSS